MTKPSFPLEYLSRKYTYNQYNAHAIAKALSEWAVTDKSHITIRLSTDSEPYFVDYTVESLNSQKSKTEGVDIELVSGRYSVSAMHNNAYSSAYSTYFEKQFNVNQISSANNSIVFTTQHEFNTGDEVLISETYLGFSALTVYEVVVLSATEIKLRISGVDFVLPISAVSKVLTISTVNRTKNFFDGDLVDIRYSSSKEIEMLSLNNIIDFSTKTVFSVGDFVHFNSGLYEVVRNHTKISGVTPLSDTSSIYYKSVLKIFDPSDSLWDSHNVGDLFLYSNNVYILVKDIDISKQVDWDAPDSLNSRFKSITNRAFLPNQQYSKGDCFYHNGYIYLVSEDHRINSFNDSKLIKSMPLPMLNGLFVNGSGVIRYTPERNISGFIYRSASSINYKLSISASYKNINGYSAYSKSTSVISTSNYLMYPLDKNPIWSDNSSYNFDSGVAYGARQSYTSSIILNHYDLRSGTYSFINYDGPDLENGLSIYLPVNVPTSSNSFVKPEDGFKFETVIKIYPNPKLNGAITRDHVINKSQIYVVSVDDIDDVYNSTTCPGNVIAKFSMARMTNHYVLSENIAIPDKPVFYKATFIYSSERDAWLVGDFYQFDDHMFIGQVGYIDPFLPELNSDGTQFLGYETGRFPMFQDPFTDDSMKPIVKTYSEYNKLTNRIVE